VKQLDQLQDEQYEWSRRNFGPQDPVLPLLGVAEEVGELCHAVLKRKQAIRMDEDHIAKEKDAIGDIVIFLMDYCNRRGFNLLELINLAWDEVQARDWNKNRYDGPVGVRDDGSRVYVNPTTDRQRYRDGIPE
jgi:NTP pyrophosphatase (non-canonical NTP hydrolase)